jgi:hypothetical protein
MATHQRAGVNLGRKSIGNLQIERTEADRDWKEQSRQPPYQSTELRGHHQDRGDVAWRCCRILPPGNIDIRSYRNDW